MKGSIITGVILAVLAVFMLMIVAVMSFALPLGFWMGAKSAEKEYDDWYEDAGSGDSITVSGKIDKEEKDDLFGETLYGYELEGCDIGFYSSSDIGNEGDYVIVTVEIDDLGLPEAKSSVPQAGAVAPNACCCCFTGIVFIVGAVLIVVGIAKGKKN